MKSMTISVTQAARNFAECVKRAHYRKVTYVLLKNGEPIARLVPENQKPCSGRELARILAEYKLPVPEAKVWRRDLQAVRKTIRSQADKWR